MMLNFKKTTGPAHPRHALASAVCRCAAGSMLTLAASGCQQAGGPGGTAGLAPISPLTGQAPMTGPTMPALGPFGASARVAPPPTGSYGNPSGLAGAAFHTTPANYAPSNVQPMSYNDAGGNHIAVAGGAPDPVVNQQAGSTWHETSTSPPPIAPHMDFSRQSNGLRSGGMPVNDLTHAPAPPGYVGSLGFAAQHGNFQSQPVPNSPPPLIQYPNHTANTLPNQTPTTSSPIPSSPIPSGPIPFTPIPSRPVSGGGIANTSPAANQPAFSNADRPVQWQAPRR